MRRDVELVFWGTRGSVPCFSGDKVRFGTNTSCLEITWSKNERIIFDAGTGIIHLGNYLKNGGGSSPKPIHLFLSHFHWDHIHGLPFFKPIYSKNHHIIIHGRPGVELVFKGQLIEPFSPIPFEALSAHIEFRKIKDPVRVGEAVIEPFELNHPQGCYGYAVNIRGKKIVYATDTERDNGPMDELLLEKSRDADCLIMDSNNSLEEDEKRQGWGHSTWRDCAAVAKAGGVHRLVLFHNDALHKDTECQRKEQLAQELFSDTLCAYDGLVLDI